MKISVSSVAFPNALLNELPALTVSVGADGLALTCSPKGALHIDASSSEVREFKMRCDDLGIAISSVYGYAGRGMLGSTRARQEDNDLSNRCIDFASALDCSVSRLFAWKEVPSDDLIDRFVEACRPTSDYAFSMRVKLGLPTHHDLAFAPTSCRRLIDGIGSDRAKIIFNGQSLELDGIDPVSALDVLYDVIEQVELKDWQRRDGEAVPVAIGRGDATVFPIIETLAKLNYRGWLTLHHLRQHHPDLAALEASVSDMVREKMATSNRGDKYAQR